MSSKLESDVCYVYGWRHLVKATEVTAGLAGPVMAAYRQVDGLKSPVGWLLVCRDQLRPQRSV